MKRDVAEKIMQEMMDIGDSLNITTSLVEKIENKDECKNFKIPIGNIMGQIYTEIMIPIIKQHPDLDPDGTQILRE